MTPRREDPAKEEVRRDVGSSIVAREELDQAIASSSVNEPLSVDAGMRVTGRPNASGSHSRQRRRPVAGPVRPSAEGVGAYATPGSPGR